MQLNKGSAFNLLILSFFNNTLLYDFYFIIKKTKISPSEKRKKKTKISPSEKRKKFKKPRLSRS